LISFLFPSYFLFCGHEDTDCFPYFSASNDPELMLVHFYIRFQTTFGQSLSISGNHPLLGADDLSAALPMQYLNEELWHVTIEVKDVNAPIRYKYLLRGVDGVWSEEWGNDRVLDHASRPVSEIVLIDTWNFAGEYENAFYTQPFQETLLLKTKKASRKIRWPDAYTHEFRVKAPLLDANQVLCLIGSSSGAGAWSIVDPALGRRENNCWIFPGTPFRLPTNTAFTIWTKAPSSNSKEGITGCFTKSADRTRSRYSTMGLCACQMIPGRAQAWPFLYSACEAARASE
jgi:hypothetical protein